MRYSHSLTHIHEFVDLSNGFYNNSRTDLLSVYPCETLVPFTVVAGVGTHQMTSSTAYFLIDTLDNRKPFGRNNSHIGHASVYGPFFGLLAGCMMVLHLLKRKTIKHFRRSTGEACL